MEAVLGGAALGAVLTALFPPIAEGINSILKPITKGVVVCVHGITTSAASAASDTADTFKDIWSEVQAESDTKRRQAATVVGAVAGGESAKLDVVDERKESKKG